MKKTKILLSVLVVLALSFSVILTACTPTTTTDKTIKLSKAGLELVVGESATLTATVSDGSDVTWSSSDESVATVSESGVVTAVATGSATITATSGDATATCSVVVRSEEDKYPAAHAKTYTSDGKNYSLKSALASSSMPSNWNELDYENSADTNILSYIQSGFFTYNYPLIDESAGRVNADGTLNVDNLNFDAYQIEYEAATALTDVTSVYGEEWGLTAEQIEKGGYIWRITLRDDLAWDDGTSIYAEDFVYTMQEQFNYSLLPFRADTYWSSNGMKIHNAKNYYYKGQTITSAIGVTSVDSLTKNEEGVYTWNGHEISLGTYTATSFLYGDSLGDYVDYYGSVYFDIDAWEILTDLADSDGYCPVTDETIAAMAAQLAVFGAEGDTATQYVLQYFTFATIEYATDLTFDDVGIFAEDKLNIVVVLDSQETWLNSDGTPSTSITNCSLPLVKKDLYESCKVEPVEGADNWTSTYCTSVATTASWGPYSLTSFQSGKAFTLGRNEYWFGYDLEENQDQYLTDIISAEVMDEEQAQILAFWAGETDSLDFTTLGDAATDYLTSDYAIYSPGGSGYAYGIQIYSKLNTENGRNNGILSITEFRQALSWSFDRVAFNSDQLIGMELGLGLLGEDYCYDAETGASYRNSDAAKSALLRAYGFTQNDDGKWTDGTTVYADIDEATDAMTGYNLTLAKQKLAEAIEILTSDPEAYGYDSSKKIQLALGQFNAKAQRRAELIQACIDKLVEGTILEGQIEVTIVDAYTNSATMFRNGEFDLYCVAAIGGAILYPFSTMDNYLGFGSLSYHSYIDISNETITWTMPEVDGEDYEGEGETLTLTIKDWFYSLNGTETENPSYNWNENNCPVEVRLQILAMLEEYALSQYHSIQVAYDSNAYLSSAKYSYITDSYSLWMGLGGGRYLRYNYTDEEWAAFVAEHNGDLSSYYKTSGN